VVRKASLEQITLLQKRAHQARVKVVPFAMLLGRFAPKNFSSDN